MKITNKRIHSILWFMPLIFLLFSCSNDNDNEQVNTTPPTVENPPEVIPLVNNLVEAANKANKRIGTALNNGALSSQESEYIDIVKREFNYATPENVAKWGSIQNSTPDIWDFSSFDSMVSFAEENGIALKGHALVWHRQMPSFINDSLTPDALSQLINQHINTTVNHYKGQLYAWDVVNEAIGDDANYRDSIIYQKLGKDFIAQAFTEAHNVDPEVKLFYNDYNINSINSKSNAVYTMVKELIEAQVPIHGVGFQMHLDAANAPSTAQMTENLKRFADLGLDVNISEIDVRVSALPWDKATKLAIQQQIYQRAVNACMNVTRCDAITVWGFTDKYSWIDGEFGPDDPLLFTEDYKRKPAYFGVADALLGIEADSTDTLPNLIANGNFEITTEGWTTSDETAVRSTAHKKNGMTSLMVAANESTKSYAAINISDLIVRKKTYDVQAWVMTQNNIDANSTLKAEFQCTGEEKSTIVVQSSLTNNTEFSPLLGELTTPDCDIETATLIIEGPATNESIYIDAVSLRPQLLTPNTEGFSENILSNSDFEIDASGWTGYDTAEVSITTEKAYSGSQSLKATNRSAEYDGPSYNLSNLIEKGATYQLFARTSISDGSAQVKATIRAICTDGTKYIGVASTIASADNWSFMAGQVTIPYCDLNDAVLYFEGPNSSTDLYIDDVTFHSKERNLGSNIVDNNDFEENTDGWSVWGGSLTTSANFAYTGSKSALHSGRTATWQGPVFNILPFSAPNRRFEISVFSRIENSTSDTLNITLKSQCAGQDAVYSGHGSVTVTNNEWTELAGNLTLPDCSLTDAVIYFEGPDVGVDIYIDHVEISIVE
jgi:GH35 family endo-1,4-beta-xylanase